MPQFVQYESADLPVLLECYSDLVEFEAAVNGLGRQVLRGERTAGQVLSRPIGTGSGSEQTTGTGLGPEPTGRNRIRSGADWPEPDQV